jgi:hypothetical protein
MAGWAPSNGPHCAPVAAAAAASSSGSTSGPIMYGAIASCVAPACRSVATAPSRLARLPRQAGATGMPSRAASMIEAASTVCLASSPPGAATTTPTESVTRLRPEIRRGRTRPPSASRSCRAPPSTGCGDRYGVRVTAGPAWATVSARKASRSGSGLRASGTTTAAYREAVPSPASRSARCSSRDRSTELSTEPRLIVPWPAYPAQMTAPGHRPAATDAMPETISAVAVDSAAGTARTKAGAARGTESRSGLRCRPAGLARAALRRGRMFARSASTRAW